MTPPRPLLLMISLFVLIGLACNAFAGNVEPEQELPPPTFEATLTPGEQPATVEGAAPTVTLPSGTAIAQETAVPPLQGPYITTLVDLNVRTGPAVQYDRVGFLLQGESAPILGVNPATGWWKIQCPAALSGSECWISGGAQYASATNAENVAVAAAPPTPTPPPSPTPTATPESGTDAATGQPGLVAYTNSTGLWVVAVDLSKSPPEAGTPVQLAAESDYSNPIISPDGQKVAILRGNEQANVLGYFNTNGEGGDMLVASVSLPNASGAANMTVLIDQVQWLPDSQSLVFSTYLVNQVGPGAAPQADLWTVALSGSPQERFAAGQGGHTFNISPTGAQVIFGLPESIVQVNLDGSNRQTVLNFAFVNTASEYAYAPLAQWLANGTTAVTAVSGADPWQPSASASLYRIQNGNAFVSGNVTGNILFSPVQWTSDGSRLGYIRLIPDGSNTQTLVIADSSGGSPQAYRTGPNLRFFGWNPANSHVLYAGGTDNTFVGVGQSGAEPVETLFPVSLLDAQWLRDNAYVMILGTGNNWNITSGNLNGAMHILATASGSSVQLAVWTP